MQAKVIFLYGPDGSGKTTLARLLYTRVRSIGFTPRISWMRGTHTLASLAARILVRFRAFRGGIDPYYGLSIPHPLKAFWILLEIISILPIVLREILIPLARGKVVIAERSLPDFVAWVSTLTGERDFPDGLIGRVILKISKRIAVAFYITSPSEVLLSRRPEDRDFILSQLPIYERIYEILGSYRVDTSLLTPEEAVSQIIKLSRLIQ